MSGAAAIPLLAQDGATGAVAGEIARDARGPRSRDQYLRDVQALAAVLPPCGHVLNFCVDRYRFLVGFGAGLVRGAVSLLPSTRTPEVLRRIEEDYPGTICLHDGEGLGALCTQAGERDQPAIPLFAFPRDMPEQGRATTVPLIPGDRTAAYVFTSGSTGTPVPHRKTWGSLVASARAEAAALGVGDRSWALIGTVPSQHMYGFESLILLALHGGASLWAGHPFYPADVNAAVAAMPRPRMLVTTPTHLRALVSAGGERPPLDKVLCATALLPEELVAQAERELGAELLEIYGCTETGQTASRRSARTRHWQLFPGVEFFVREGSAWARGGHVLQETPLADLVEIVDREHFALLGRSTEVVNIAGKRGSLANLNHALLSIPGVADGCMFVPDAAPASADEPAGLPDSTRLCAVVVAPQLDTVRILRALRRKIDPAFLPRPVILVESLPRNATGKIPREALLALHRQHQGRAKNPRQ